MELDRPMLPVTKMNSVINSSQRDMLRNMILNGHALHHKQDFIKQAKYYGYKIFQSPIKFNFHILIIVS